MTKIFNIEKSSNDYKSDNSLFFGCDVGLFDTVNKHHPKIWAIYKEIKSLDWSEDEFDYSQCNQDFKNCPKSVYDIMIRTLAWQWEADSIVCRNIAPVLAPFITDSSLWAAWQRISDNEVVHAATYSEIVRMSFDDPEQVFEDILSVKESIVRLGALKTVLDKLYITSHRYALGDITSDEAYDDLFMGIVGYFLLERVQFMASFAITFTICSTGIFQSIGKAVQKICQDELEVHVALDMEVLRVELQTKRGKAAYLRLKQKIKELCDDVVLSELNWCDYIFSEGRELVGGNINTVKSWVLFNAKPVYKFLDIQSEYKFPAINPMPHLEDWINIGKTQSAPQEENNNQYKVGVIVNDDVDIIFELDF